MQTMKTANDFIAVEDIENDILYSKTGYIFSYLYVKSNSYDLLSSQELSVYFDNITKVLETQKEPFQILSMPRTIDTIGMLSYLTNLKNKCAGDSRLKLLDGEIGAIKDMERIGSKEPILILKLFSKANKNAVNILNMRTNSLISDLNSIGISSTRLSDKEITYICKIFANLEEYQDINEDIYEDIPTIAGKKRIFSKKEPEFNEIDKIVTPVNGLEFKSNSLRFGNVYSKILSVSKYPAEVRDGFLVDILNCTSSVTSIIFNPRNSDEIADKLSVAVRRNMQTVDSQRDYRQRKALEREVSDADEMIDRIDDKKENIGLCSIFSMPFSNTPEELNDTLKDVTSLFSRHRIKTKILSDMGMDLFKCISPYHAPDEKILNITNQIMPLSTLAGGSPFTVNIFRDDKGCYFGKTETGSIVSIDLDFRGKDRTNSNIVVVGLPGGGKSTVVKHLIMTDFMKGAKIIVIDPEGEYKELCKNLDGSFFDTGGGKAKINIFQIKIPPKDDDEEQGERIYESSNMLALHIRSLEVFFSLYSPRLKDDDFLRAKLKETLIELYQRFNISWDTDIQDFTSDMFPIFSDLYSLLVEKGESYSDLALLLKDISIGADSFLWNGHTNIDTDNQFILLNTTKLSNSSDNIKRAQYYNVLTLAWDIMERRPDENVVLICDEAYLMIDPNIPESLYSLRNIAKRCRKREGKLMTAFHSATDVLDPKIKMYGQGLLDDPTYKIFFGTNGKNLKELSELFNLTENEQGILLRSERGVALVYIGSSKMKIRFDLPKYKLDLMGFAGGR